MIRVNDYGDTVCLGNRANILGTGNSTKNRGFLVLVINGLTGNIGSTTVRELDDDGRSALLGSFESSVNSTIFNAIFSTLVLIL